MKAIPPSVTATYTAAEIVQILERAKALGVRQLKIEGFEAAWDIPPPPPAAPAAPPPMVDDGAAGGHRAPAAAPAERHAHGPQRENVRLVNEWCPDCRSQMEIGRWDKPYCKRCYMEKMDRKRAAESGGYRR